MGKMQREKGKRGEREVCKLLQQFGFSAHRSRQFSGAIDPDVVVDANLWVEVKFVQRIAAERFLEQAESDAKDGLTPVVFMRSNGGQWMTLCRATHLPDLARIMQARADAKGSHEQKTHTTADPEPESPTG